MSPPAELPVPLTAFVGREQELAWVRSLLVDPEVRLLTLAGPPGVGKTRLAIQAAGTAADVFEDGVSFVALAPMTDPEEAMPAIAPSVGRFSPGRLGALSSRPGDGVACMRG